MPEQNRNILNVKSLLSREDFTGMNNHEEGSENIIVLPPHYNGKENCWCDICMPTNYDPTLVYDSEDDSDQTDLEPDDEDVIYNGQEKVQPSIYKRFVEAIRSYLNQGWW